MSPRPARFDFGRLNVLAQFENKRDFLHAGLGAGNLMFYRDYAWGFFDVEEIPQPEGFITGYLVKVSPQESEEVGNLATHELTHLNVANRALTKSRFFLHMRTGLLAYEVVSNRIDARMFRDRFRRVFEDAFNQFFISVEIQPVENRFEFFSELQRFTRLEELSISLHPTNPSYDELYRAIDERLKELEASKYREQYFAAPNTDGLQVISDDEIRRKAVMAEDGYGYASARGLQDGQTKTVTTGANPVSTRAVTIDLSPIAILDQLRTTFGEIMERIRHE